MKAEDFIEKFGWDIGKNENCLQHMGCPNCGQREHFQIEVTTMADVNDDGTDANVRDHEWEGSSLIYCEKCNHGGTASEFTHEGLDHLIEEKKGNQTP